MTETENSTSSTTAESRRTVTDFVLAGCICAVAAGFWFWNSGPVASDVAPAAVTQPVVVPAAPTGSDRFNNVGMQLYSASDFTGAEAQFRQAIAAEPGMALGYCNLGAALVAEHRYDEAIAALQHSVALDPTLTLARNNLKWALDEKKKHTK